MLDTLVAIDEMGKYYLACNTRIKEYVFTLDIDRLQIKKSIQDGRL